MENVPTHLSIEREGEVVTIAIDETTAIYLRYVIAAIGEHIAGGFKIPPMSVDMADRLRGVMLKLEDVLGVQ